MIPKKPEIEVNNTDFFPKQQPGQKTVKCLFGICIV